MTTNRLATGARAELKVPDFSNAYETLSLFQSGPPVHSLPVTGKRAYAAVFLLDGDLSPMFPLLWTFTDCFPEPTARRAAMQPVWLLLLPSPARCALRIVASI